MNFLFRVASVLLFVQSAAAFKPSHVPRKTVELKSLIDEAYDVPSISQSYSRTASKVAQTTSDVVKEVPKAVEKAADEMPKFDIDLSNVELPKLDIDLSDVASKAQSATTEASAKVAEASAQMTSAVDDFMKAAGETMKTSTYSLQSAKSTGLSYESFKPLTSPLSPSNFVKVPPAQPLEPGKVRTLAGYIREKIEDGSLSVKVPDGDSLADAKSKFALLVSNTYRLFGQDAPAQIPALPDGSEGWIATGVVSLIALGQRNAGMADARALMGDMVTKEAAAVAEIADQLKSMESEIRQLQRETKNLSKELEAANSKLTAKELALSKERLSSADKELKLTRVINDLTIKLSQSERKVGAQTEKKVETQTVQKVESVDKTEVVKSEIPVAKVVEQPVEEESPAPAPTPAPKTKKSPKGKPKTVRVVESVVEESEKPAKQAVKGSTKKTTAKKATTKKETVKKTKTTKTATKAKETKAEETKSDDDQAWSTLSQSTLLRKTVKELSEYLATKGVTTTGEDGKTLKKAQLVEAVQAL